ncbi:hypothetical protein ACFVYF_34485 [Streptomyces sp. NPDC058274]|uniref:hypothetical protein n=1 Tax=Streptomyces sp. NPDC058274 TaxID=3346416 RepID=UPI0036E846A9
MTSPPNRSRSRRAASHIGVRVAHAVFGMLVAVGWLVAPIAAASADDPVNRSADGLRTSISGAPLSPPAGGTDPAGPGVRTDATRAAPAEDETSTGDLALPLVAAVAAGTLAAYSYLRRKRRAHTRTTPGGAPPRNATADDSAEPTEPTEPTEATEATEATQPSGPAEPSVPAVAADPTGPAPGPDRGRDSVASEAPDAPDSVESPHRPRHPRPGD